MFDCGLFDGEEGAHNVGGQADVPDEDPEGGGAVHGRVPRVDAQAFLAHQKVRRLDARRLVGRALADLGAEFEPRALPQARAAVASL